MGVAAVAALVGLVVLASLLLARRGHPVAGGVLSAVPHDAWLVAFVDVAALRASPIAKPVLDTGSATAIPGVGSLLERCGFDPVTKLRQLVVTSPELEIDAGDSDFGIAFSGDFGRDELSACAEKVILAHGGQPSTSKRGTFSVIEDTSGGKRARVAYRDGGPFLVGRGAWLDAMMDAAEGKADRERPEHAALRAALSKQGAPPRAITVTALLPKALRERLKAEMAGEGGGGEPEKSYASVLAVEQAGLSVGTGGPESTTDIAVELRCESTADCEAVRDLALRKRLALSRNFGVRVIGLGPLLDTLAVDVHDCSLSASTHAPTADLARAVQRAVDLQTMRRPADQPGPSPTPGQPPHP